MKRLLITAGGTAIAWHICKICKEYYRNKVEVFICDTNDAYLVPASILAVDTFKVPFAHSPDYLFQLERIIVDNKIDIIIPLIPDESVLLSKDSDFIQKTGIKTSTPSDFTIKSLADKYSMFRTLNSLNIHTPRIIEKNELVDSKSYFVKPRFGFGSLNTGVYTGKQINNCAVGMNDHVIQELCDNREEVTVEVFNGEFLRAFARRRVATKSGVCVKMEPYDNQPFLMAVEKLVESFDMPTAFNLQFLYDKSIWKLFDCNLRLGAGTALASAAKFQLTRAFIANLINEKVNKEWFEVDRGIKSVLRVYDEVVIK